MIDPYDVHVLAERLYLWLTGWKDLGDDDGYAPPDSYPYRTRNRYDRGHAVNAQKLVDQQRRRKEGFYP